MASAVLRWGVVMRAIGVFLAIQLAGFAFDAVWHGLRHPGFQADTVREMAVHLATVHLPLYVGVAGFFASVAVFTFRHVSRGVLWIALAGAALQVAGESWHAWTHLRLAPDAALPGMLSLLGLLIALAALATARRLSRMRHVA